MNDDFEQEDYEVGYRKPPRNRRFRKGVSGNPSGRPKKRSDFLSMLLEELNSQLTITVNGKRKRIRKSDVIIKQFANKASNGHLPTLRLLLPLYLQALQKKAEDDQRALDKANSLVDLNELTDAELAVFAMGGHKKIIPDGSGG